QKHIHAQHAHKEGIDRVGETKSHDLDQEIGDVAGRFQTDQVGWHSAEHAIGPKGFLPGAFAVFQDLFGRAFPLEDITLEHHFPIKYYGRKIKKYQKIKRSNSQKVGQDVFLEID